MKSTHGDLATITTVDCTCSRQRGLGGQGPHVDFETKQTGLHGVGRDSLPPASPALCRKGQVDDEEIAMSIGFRFRSDYPQLLSRVDKKKTILGSPSDGGKDAWSSQDRYALCRISSTHASGRSDEGLPPLVMVWRGGGSGHHLGQQLTP